jgi:HD-like signal output (HDOD) protein
MADREASVTNTATLLTVADHFQRLIHDKALTLPMLPAVTTEVLNLVDDELCNSAKLAKLIESDQALAAHVMRLANSVAFCPVGTLNSLQQAITRLGMSNITEIAVAVSVSPNLFKVTGYEDEVQRLWQTSLATASWARAIARATRRNSEAVFLCGLLHQIGKPAVLQAAIELREQHQLDLSDVMLDQLLASYEVIVGTDLAIRWCLPEAVEATIASFAGQPADEKYRNECETVFAARVLAEYMLNSEQMSLDAVCNHPAMITVGIDERQLAELLENENQIRDTVNSLLL